MNTQSSMARISDVFGIVIEEVEYSRSSLKQAFPTKPKEKIVFPDTGIWPIIN